MSLILNGNTIGSVYLGSNKIGEGYFGNVKVIGSRSEGAITITKMVNGTGYSASKTFNIVVTFSEAIQYALDGIQIATASTTCSLNLKHGDSATISKIPMGVSYSIVESALPYTDVNAGYSIGTITNNSGTISSGEAILSTANNEYDPDSVVIQGRKYRTTTIGTQRWLAENLNYVNSNIPLNGAKNVTTAACWYYNSASSEPVAKYGLLYNWYAANYLNNNRNSLFRGWRVPVHSDMETLRSYTRPSVYVGPYQQLKATTRWSTAGLDTYKFTAYPSGELNGNTFSYLGSYFCMLLLDKFNSYYHFWQLQNAQEGYTNGQQVERRGLSIRLIYG